MAQLLPGRSMQNMLPFADRALVCTKAMVVVRPLPSLSCMMKLLSMAKPGGIIQGISHNVVVICLGGNDLSVDLDSAQFVNTYIQFVQKIRLQYPRAKIICVAGSFGPGNKWVKFQSHVLASANHFRSIDKNVYYFKFSPFAPKEAIGTPM